MRRLLPGGAFLTTMATAMLVGGCTVMSESECLNADWYLVGQQDGRDGLPGSQLAAYAEACAKFGVRPVREEYEEGRTQGLTHYCTDLNGYREGKSGFPYHQVCPASVEPDFLYGYDTGVTVRMAVVRVERVLGGIDEVEDDLRGVKRDIRKLENPEDSEESKEQDKDSSEANAAANLKKKYRELGRLEGELEGLQRELGQVALQYRRTVDEARRRGFAELYVY